MLVSSRFERDLFSPTNFQVENEMSSIRKRYGEAFWRAHHEAWVQSELNQREYCEAYGIPLEAFGNWRAKFKAEPQTPARKVLYRRGRLSHTPSHGLSHDLPIGPIIPPAREGQPLAARLCTGEQVAGMNRDGIALQGAEAGLSTLLKTIHFAICALPVKAASFNARPIHNS
jgi:hypothetical protein